jgi:NAD(P)-dependent dehydrogenase (short-subunit alcohol dehydrogenase family)
MEMTDKLFSLEGKVSLVTGAAHGIGLGISKALANAGSELILVDKIEKQLEEVSRAISQKTGKRALAIPGDLARIEEIERIVRHALKEFAGIDVLINNAGTTVRKPFLEISSEEFDHVIAVNLRAPYFLSQKIARHMMERKKGGKIINVASLTSQIGMQNISAYGASKGGVYALTKTMAVELAPYKICVNAIAPGFFQTQLTEPVWQDHKKFEWALSRIPLGRVGIPEDAAGAVIFLASPASDYITGEVLFVDGGWMSA